MIPRTLVPTNVRPPSPDEVKRPAKRTTTYMDDRTVVPPELSDAPPLDGKSSIPSHLPLDVLVNRTLVPRGMPAKPLEKLQEAAQYSIAVMDERVVVPAYVEPLVGDLLKEFDKLPEMTPELREVVEPDMFITGDPNLLVATEPKRSAKYDALVRTASLIFHVLLVIFLVLSPKIFPYHPPSQEEMDLARHALNFVYLPPEVSKPAAPPGPRMHISPRVLNKISPPTYAPPVAPPGPAPSAKPAPELPAAPVPKVPANPAPQPAPSTSTPKPSDIEPIKPQPSNPGHYNLNLPSSSPNRDLRDQIQDAIRRQGGGGGIIPSQGGLPRGGGGGGGGGQRGPGMGGNLQMLTPTDGVDFSSYIQRLLATVRQNWYSVMPESAYMGEKGIVSITFRINQDGSVPPPDPNLERTSGRQPLDNAAMSSIRMSNPFEPLPSAYKRPYMEFRFIYFYNLPMDTPY
jgi:outer membrane biosynthesis protein TonB